MKVFDKYSSYYDLLYKDKDYKSEAVYIDQLIKKENERLNNILDLGCGTGKHAYELAQLGYHVDGVDLSESMIDTANKNKDDLFQSFGSHLHFTQGDARTYRDNKKYDVVVALFHVMSYQTRNEDLEALYQTAKVHLKKGGLFIFDFWYGPAVLTDPPVVRVKRLDDNAINVTRIAEPLLHANENIVDVNYSVLIKEKESDIVEEIKEQHRMRYLFLPELALLDDKFVFTRRHAFEWRTFESATIASWNVVVSLINEA